MVPLAGQMCQYVVITFSIAGQPARREATAVHIRCKLQCNPRIAATVAVGVVSHSRRGAETGCEMLHTNQGHATKSGTDNLVMRRARQFSPRYAICSRLLVDIGANGCLPIASSAELLRDKRKATTFIKTIVARHSLT